MKRHGRRGFTLIEVVLALGILTLACGSLVALNNRSLAAVADSRDTARSAWLARRQMGLALTEKPPESEEETFPEPFLDEQGNDLEPGYLWSRKVTDVPFLDPETQEAVKDYGFWEVAIRIHREDAPSDQAPIELVTRIEKAKPAQPGPQQ